MDADADQIEALTRDIAETETYLRDHLDLPLVICQSIEASLAEKRATLARLHSGTAPPSPSAIKAEVNFKDDAKADGVVVGVNLGRIIYGRDPAEDEREQLQRYLTRLAAKMRSLPLVALTSKRDSSADIVLTDIYVMLAVQFKQVVARGPKQQMTEIYCDWGLDQGWQLKPQYSPFLKLPHEAITRLLVHALEHGQPADSVPARDGFASVGQVTLDKPLPQLIATTYVHHGLTTWDVSSDDTRELIVTFMRDMLASEALAQERCLVVLGDPGGGKSTLLRHLAWVFARRGLDDLSPKTQLLGWAHQQRLIPIFLPLRTLAGELAKTGASVGTISAAIRGEMAKEYDARRPDDLLDKALYRGKALVLFDGLDEVPLIATPDVADRQTTLAAVAEFARLHEQSRCVITCRTRAFTPDLDAVLGWRTMTLEPFTVGQMRHFIDHWYRLEAINKGFIDAARATEQRDSLIALILSAQHFKLREMAGNPLLLTMMVLVLFEQGQLPRDRPTLYEQMLTQLLGKWDTHRGGQSLTKVIGDERVGSDQIRPILDQLSYDAHRAATSSDGRGRLQRDALLQALSKYFRKVGVAGAYEAAERCLQYFDERSGLLLPEDDGEVYAFAHLTLQEHCAGRHLVLHDDGVRLVMHHRTDDRWREPIFLGMGVIQQFHAPLLSRVESILSRLIDDEEAGHPKPRARWYRDLILAAELGVERDWQLLSAHIDVPRLQRDLKKGLVALLSDPSQPLSAAEQVRAGFLLGDLGDPRIPVTLEEWRAALEKVQRGEESGYFCRVPASTYLIGSHGDDDEAEDIERPQHRFVLEHDLWMARYPFTNNQWELLIQAGFNTPYSADETVFNHPTQPIVGLSWNSVMAGIDWLCNKLSINLRLPHEYEWEIAARGSQALRYPWGNKWCEDHAVSEENQESRGWQWSLPVGCFPSGISPLGLLDMAGNVWEWCINTVHSYPGVTHPFSDDTYRVLRGGSYLEDKIYLRTTQRGKALPDWDFNFNNRGFRVCLIPNIRE